MNLDFFLQALSYEVQFVGNLTINAVLLFVLALVLIFITDNVIDYLLREQKISRSKADLAALSFAVWSVFLIALPVGVGMAELPDSIPAVLGLYNPVLGVYPFYIAYKLKVAAASKNEL